MPIPSINFTIPNFGVPTVTAPGIGGVSAISPASLRRSASPIQEAIAQSARIFQQTEAQKEIIRESDRLARDRAAENRAAAEIDAFESALARGQIFTAEGLPEGVDPREFGLEPVRLDIGGQRREVFTPLQVEFARGSQEVDVPDVVAQQFPGLSLNRRQLANIAALGEPGQRAFAESFTAPGGRAVLESLRTELDEPGQAFIDEAISDDRVTRGELASAAAISDAEAAAELARRQQRQIELTEEQVAQGWQQLRSGIYGQVIDNYVGVEEGPDGEITHRPLTMAETIAAGAAIAQGNADLFPDAAIPVGSVTNARAQRSMELTSTLLNPTSQEFEPMVRNMFDLFFAGPERAELREDVLRRRDATAADLKIRLTNNPGLAQALALLSSGYTSLADINRARENGVTVRTPGGAPALFDVSPRALELASQIMPEFQSGVLPSDTARSVAPSRRPTDDEELGETPSERLSNFTRGFSNTLQEAASSSVLAEGRSNVRSRYMEMRDTFRRRGPAGALEWVRARAQEAERRGEEDLARQFRIMESFLRDSTFQNTAFRDILDTLDQVIDDL